MCSRRPGGVGRMVDWVMFLGWYLAAGTVDGAQRQRAQNRMGISQNVGWQSEQVNAACEGIARALGCAHSIDTLEDREVEAHYLFSTQLAVYLAQLGDKHIPRELLALSQRQLRLLFDALMAGDGSMGDRDRRDGRYSTSSKQLADDIQQVALQLGPSATLPSLPPHPPPRASSDPQH